MTAASFQDALRAAGFDPPPDIQPGKFYRFGTNGKGHDKAGYCKLFADGEGGIFGDWRTGEQSEWHATAPETLTPEQRTTRRRQADEARQQAEAERMAAYQAAAVRARRIWEGAALTPVESYYLQRKGIAPHGARIDVDGRLVLPVHGPDGELQSLQFIAPNGEKRFLPDGKMGGGWCGIGTPAAGAPLLLAEGFATAASLHQATGRAVLCCFTAGNLVAVAKVARARWADSPLLICGDDDTGTPGNPGRQRAEVAAIATGARVVFPTFASNTEGTDFNDLAQAAGIDEVRRQIEAATPASGATPQKVGAGDTAPGHFAHDVILTCGADIRPEPIEWIWPGFLAAGKLEILSGAPGCGKTTIALSLAAILTAGNRWPDGSNASAAAVAIWSAEDDAADTLAPRLLAAGADMRSVHFVTATASEEGERRPFDPATDTFHLARALAGLKVRLLIIDPVVNAVAGDSHKNTETRRALQPLVDLAGKLGCAVLGITHFSKGTQGRDPVERVTGSIAFGALARLVFAAAKAGDDDVDADGCDRLFVRSKSNIGPDGGGWRYALEQVAVPGHSQLFASRVRWGLPLEGEARALLATAEAATGPEERNALADAVEFLRSLLTDGPLPAKAIRSDGENAGHTWRTMHRAADRLNVERRKEGMRGGWVWRLPLAAKMPATPPEGARFPEQEKLAPSETLAPSGEEPPL